ncbi:ABC transporter permease [Candidimonas nitroreducens]|uniref:ABC transporter permease n=1 Tax=Candidimonas nitroreducens TaxID=683354 RepID=A0A225M651_9BURK|nr:ABC transporter permease [Candidimonas nitroreducens]OWT55713.1 ABC transporter permease [Candidimonas nitroreducens]
MKRYLMRYALQFIPVLLIISLIVFVLVYMAGDPVALMLPDSATPAEIATLRESLGLNRPFLVQFWIFLTHICSGDFGMSFRYHADAMSVVLSRLPASVELGMLAMAFALAVSIPLGIWSAIRRNSSLDVLITGASVAGKAMPTFWLGLMLILIFAVKFRVFPVSGSGGLSHMILPAITLGGGAAAEIARLVRSNMIETLGQDYIRTARSKGLGDFDIIFRHAFKNCLNPVITMVTVQLPFLIGGSLITETVFAYPGVGQLLVQAVNARDMSVVEAGVFLIALIVIFMNMVGDVLYRLVDHRIKY